MDSDLRSIPGSSPAVSYVQSCSNRPANVEVSWKRVEVLVKDTLPFPCYPMNRECLWKKTQIEKKVRKQVAVEYSLTQDFLSHLSLW